MNWKQEIAVWFFGLLLALGLLFTDHEIWAVALVAGLTILSLRDRQKNKGQSPKRASEANASHNNLPVQNTPEATLKEMTPHSLAVAMLQLVHERGEWRASAVETHQEANEAVAVACEFYELRIFLD